MPQRTAPPLVLSLLLHVVLLTVLGLVFSRVTKGTGAEADRPVGIAMVHRLPDRDRYTDAAESRPQPERQQPETDPQPTEASSRSSAAAPPADLAPPLDLPGMLREMKSAPAPSAASGLAGDAALGDGAFEGGASPQSTRDDGRTTTNLFGVSGSGSRFVYVFDRSDSMNGYGGKPLRAAKAELLRSLRTLSERQRFQLIFYNDKPKPFKVSGLPLQLLRGEPSMLDRAGRYVDAIAAFGGTEHDTALKMALRMGPDVIFFLTDARIPRLSQTELLTIRRRAEESATTIHAIEFGTEPIAPVDSFLRDLAAQNGGQYQYINVQKLGASAR